MSHSGRGLFKKLTFIISIITSFFSIFGKKGNLFLLNFSRNINGNLGIGLRYVFLKNAAKEIGNNVSIHSGCYIISPENLIIGNNVSIHPMCYISCTGGVEIGNNVSIAHSSTLLSTTHTYENHDLPIKYNPVLTKPLIIENDVWIGCGVRVIAGITIQRRSIIAANAVITKNVKPQQIIAGVPGKIIKNI